MASQDEEAVAIAAIIRDDLREIQEALDMQHRMAEQGGDEERALQVHAIRANLQTAQGHLDDLGSALADA